MVQREQWQQIHSRLRPGGCIVANLGATTLIAQVMQEALPGIQLSMPSANEHPSFSCSARSALGVCPSGH